MGKKIIRLTEDDLKEIVQNATKDILTEMAVPIKVFKSKDVSFKIQFFNKLKSDSEIYFESE